VGGLPATGISARQGHLAALRRVYAQLWHDTVSEIEAEAADFDRLQRKHVERLADWLLATNPFVKDVNGTERPEVVDVVCSEYSAMLQMSILQIDITSMREPVLDLGCGAQANLVKYLRSRGLEAYGVDRLCDPSTSFLSRAHWLEFDLQPRSWGTIVSNQAFSLHFVHHDARKDGDYEEYAMKYMAILNSLKRHGAFHYASGLPFVEKYLPAERYSVGVSKVSEMFSSVRVERVG